MFRRAVGGLQRNAAVGQRRADLHDRSAIARFHAAECSEGTVDRTKICNVGDALKFLRRHLDRGREHRDHGIVDPNVDRAESILNPCCRGLNLVGIAHIGWNHEGAAAKFFNLLCGSLEARFSAGE